MSSATALSAKKMEYGSSYYNWSVRLGKSGLKISKIVLGCMSYGNPNCRLKIARSYDAGINAFDTSNVYSNGLLEEVLGHAIKQHNLPRDEIVVMTKVFFAVSRDPTELPYGKLDMDSDGYVNQYGLNREKHIFDSVKHSLHRLQLDYIDVLQCHRFDPNTPTEETMQALHDVVKAGYVRYVGMSSCYARETTTTCCIVRREEREMMPTLKHFGVGAIPWSPLARGALTRPLLTQEATKRETSDGMPPNTYTQSTGNQTIVNRVEEVAKKRAISMTQVLSKETSSLRPLSTPPHSPIWLISLLWLMAHVLAAIHIKLTEEEIKYLEEPYQPMVIVSH
ncbi:Aldo/keto reductase [Mycena latifolia]|nr:Aldo/keto reductase [Mycena latifolia]